MESSGTKSEVKEGKEAKEGKIEEVGVLDAIGGHGTKEGKGAPILVQGNKILKPFQVNEGGNGKNRGEAEALFYKEVYEKNHPITSVLPDFFGIHEQDIDGQKQQFLVLENLLHGFKKPCILDLKMGQKSYGENASPEKAKKESLKYPPQEQIGFRLVGMKVFHPKSTAQQQFVSSRKWCQEISVEEMPNALARFFFDGEKLQLQLLHVFLEKLHEIKEILEKHSNWRIYGSSLLVVYDAHSDLANGESINLKKEIRVKMIDFAHVFPISDSGKDDGYILGLNFIISSMRTVLSSSDPKLLVGGHGKVAKLKDGVLVKSEDLNHPETFDSEINFYRETIRRKDPLMLFMPNLISTELAVSPRELHISDETIFRLTGAVKENANKISIMDIKLGFSTYEADCENVAKKTYFEKYDELVTKLSQKVVDGAWKTLSKQGINVELGTKLLGKRDYLAFRDATTMTSKFGFRLSGISCGESGFIIQQNEARLIRSKTKFLTSIRPFFIHKSKLKKQLLEKVIDELQNFKATIMRSTILKEYRLIGSSLLVIHNNSTAKVRLIDFAHAKKEPGGCAKEYTTILDNVITTFSDIN